MDKIGLIKAVARNLGDLVVDAIPASATGSFVDIAALVHPQAGQLRGFHYFIYGGAGASQSRVVATFDPANNRLGFDYAFTTVPSTNSTGLLTERFSIDDYETAFERAWYGYYHHRNNLRARWQNTVDQYTRMQSNWAAERVAEQDNWHAVKLQEQTSWTEAQTEWKNGLEEQWVNYHSVTANPFFSRGKRSLPTLGISSVGSLPVGSLPIGSLYVGTLALAAVTEIGSINAYTSTVPDTPFLAGMMEEFLIEEIMLKEPSWTARLDPLRARMTDAMQSESGMESRLVETTNDVWEKAKLGFGSAWTEHKSRYEENWGRFKTDYEQHKLSVEQRWADMKELYK